MKQASSICIVVLAICMVGCSAATVASYLPIFETAVNGVITLVAPQYAADATKIETALNDVATAVTTAQSDTTISAKLGEVETAASQLETDLGVSGNTDAKLAIALLDLSIGTYEAILAKNAPAATATASAAFKPAATTVKLAKPTNSYPTSSGAYKREYNKLVKQFGHPEMQQKLTMAEHLHLR